jgi:hypothetical protein
MITKKIANVGMMLRMKTSEVGADVKSMYAMLYCIYCHGSFCDEIHLIKIKLELSQGCLVLAVKVIHNKLPVHKIHLQIKILGLKLCKLILQIELYKL